jgi:hypothetical protein
LKLLDIIGDLFYFSRGKNIKDEDFNENKSEDITLICRFVLDGLGKKIGESIAIDEDIIIIKSREKYLGIPLKHIEESGKKLIVKGLIDQGKAEKLGEKWRKTSYNLIDSPKRLSDGF